MMWWIVLLLGCWGPSAPSPPEGTPPASFVTPAAPSGQPLSTLLVTEHALALSQGRVPYVQVYADWCGPCVALRESMSDPRMVDAFAGVHVVQLDLERWETHLIQALHGPGKVSVPSFYEVLPDGSLGRSIDGHAWGENIPENMAPPLRAYFRGGSAAPEPRGSAGADVRSQGGTDGDGTDR